MISETQYNKIQNLIKKGIDEGAKLVAGGPGKPKGLEKGYFVKPTVFADVNNNMDIARTEIFGPVLSVMPFETEEEAIQIANDTPYGLTNYIQTQDKEKVKRVARKLRSGMVDVNGAGIAVDAPFGGFKHSGIREEAMGLLRLAQHWPDNADVRLTVQKVIKDINKVFPTEESFNEAFDKWKAAKVKKGQAKEGVYVEDLKKTLEEIGQKMPEERLRYFIYKYGLLDSKL